MKKSFIIHNDTLGILDKLTDEQAGKLFKTIKAYHNKDDDHEPDDTIDLIFFPFKIQFDRDEEKYQNIVNRNKINGSKGGRPEKPKKPSGLSGNPSKAKKADSVSVSDNDSDKEKKKTKRFAPPSLEELKAYIKEKNLNVGAETFINHYETNGWKVGKNKMVSWKHAAANWSKRNNEQNKDERESSEKKWQDSATGIRDKGKQLGLRESDFDGFPQFKNAVMAENRRIENAR